MTAGTYLLVYDMSGCHRRVVLEDESTIDAAVEQHLSTNGARDALLSLTTVEGATYKIRASRVTDWMITSPETRAKATAFEAALAAETPPDWETANG